jgi:HEAT repeat protein
MSESHEARKPAVHRARRLQEESDVEALLAELEDSSRGYAAGKAAEALAEMGERRAIEPLYRRLRAMGRGPFDEEYELSDWVSLAAALGSLEGPRSAWADELLATLKQEDSPVGWYAGCILADMDDRRAIEAIIESLTAADASDEQESWKWEQLSTALRELRAVEAVDVLSAALPQAYWSAKEEITWALMDIGDPRAVPALVAGLEARHGHYGAAENAILVALDKFATPEAKQAVDAHRRSLEANRPKGRRFWFF